MAYSKNPTLSTYDTRRIAFVSNPQQRSSDANKDLRFVNTFVEVIPTQVGEQKKTYIRSRPGMDVRYSTATGEGRGVYLWNLNGVEYVMSAVGNQIYANSTPVRTLTTSSGHVGFTEHINAAGVVTLVVVDGTKGYVFSNATTSVEITDVDFPTPHIPMPIFLDGYLFLAKAGTQDIYNSDLDDPTLWTAGSFISAEMYPDKIVALSKNNNYIYAVGGTTVEYFYDAATPSGSPLARHATAVQQFGTAAPYTVVQTDKEVILVGNTGNGGHTVWLIDGFKGKEIGIPSVKSQLLAEGAAMATATASVIRVSSQKLFVLCLSTRTFVYSFDTELWHEWKSSTTKFLGKYGTDGLNGAAYIQGASTGIIYSMDETKFTDAGTPIVCEIITSKLDFDSINRKFMYRLSLVGDIPTTPGSENDITVQWSDDDYVSWSSNRTLRLSNDLPAIFQLGKFRRRAFKFTYTAAHLLRLEGMEVDINKGGT